MMDLAVVQMGEAALNSLGVQYRVVLLSGGALFFCDYGGVAFDLLLNSGSSRVWKLLCTDTVAEVDTQLVYQNPSCPQEEFGFVVEEKGVVNCYLERNIKGKDKAQEIITRQLIWFTKLVHDLGF